MNKKKNLSKRNLEFLYEIGALRLIARTWQRFHLPDVQNLTEHHYRVMWIALILAEMEGVKDTAKIMKMAVLHDLAESRTGDVDYLSRQYVKRDEETGMQDMLRETVFEDEFLSLWKEYEERKTIEAKIVKDADNLDVDLELKELEAKGHTLPNLWHRIRKNAVKKKFFTNSAKRLLDDIQQSNPYDWHLMGRNRFNDGDWKKNKK